MVSAWPEVLVIMNETQNGINRRLGSICESSWRIERSAITTTGQCHLKTAMVQMDLRKIAGWTEMIWRARWQTDREKIALV